MQTPSFSTDKKAYCVVLCGGAGTRLWPLSSAKYPKQFLQLGGGTDKSLLQLTIDRLKGLFPPERLWLVTHQDYVDLCQQHVGEDVGCILQEPCARNTAPAIVYATKAVLQQEPEATIVFLPSDHMVHNARAFQNTLIDALNLAQQHLFVTIGIVPHYPATGFGYIELGLPLDQKGQFFSQKHHDLPFAHSVRSFHEKPTQSVAEQFLRTEKYLWNAGMFVWQGAFFWEALTYLDPALTQGIEDFWQTKDPELYASLPNVSIDIAFLEKTTQLACVPATFDWNDVGSWNAVHSCLKSDADGNVVQGRSILVETHGSLVHSTGPLISVVGLSDLIVVATEDSVLVMPLSKAQDVKKIVERLQE